MLTVNEVDAKMLTPVIAPVFLIESFDDEDEFFDLLRNVPDPLIICIAEIGRGGE